MSGNYESSVSEIWDRFYEDEIRLSLKSYKNFIQITLTTFHLSDPWSWFYRIAYQILYTSWSRWHHMERSVEEITDTMRNSAGFGTWKTCHPMWSVTLRICRVQDASIKGMSMCVSNLFSKTDVWNIGRYNCIPTSLFFEYNVHSFIYGKDSLRLMIYQEKKKYFLSSDIRRRSIWIGSVEFYKIWFSVCMKSY